MDSVRSRSLDQPLVPGVFCIFIHLAFYSLLPRQVAIKTFSAFIFLTNCASQSQREKVVGDLGTLMQVDVFGACGQPSPVGGNHGTPGILLELNILEAIHNQISV